MIQTKAKINIQVGDIFNNCDSWWNWKKWLEFKQNLLIIYLLLEWLFLEKSKINLRESDLLIKTIHSGLVKTIVFIVNLTLSVCSANPENVPISLQRCSGKDNVLVVEFEQYEFTFHQWSIDHWTANFQQWDNLWKLYKI